MERAARLHEFNGHFYPSREPFLCRLTAKGFDIERFIALFRLRPAAGISPLDELRHGRTAGPEPPARRNRGPGRTIEDLALERGSSEERPSDEEFLSLFRMKLIDELAPAHADAVALYRAFRELARNGDELDRYLLGLLDIVWRLREGDVVNNAAITQIGKARAINGRHLADIWMMRTLVYPQKRARDERA